MRTVLALRSQYAKPRQQLEDIDLYLDLDYYTEVLPVDA
jgi:hypothetical protein